MITTPALEPKIPPQNIDAEQVVIGACLLEREAIIRAEETLQPVDFYRESHRTIYAAILALQRKRQVADLFTVGTYLRDREQLDMCGGALYLTTITERAAGAVGGVTHYARMVKKCAVHRQLITDADAIMSNAYRQDLELDDIINDAGKRITAYSLTTKRETVASVGEYAYREYESTHRAATQKQPQGFVTGWASVNDIVRPFRPGQMIGVSADTGVGKSAFTFGLAVDLAEQGRRGHIFSLEMKGQLLALRAVLEKAPFTMDDLDNIHAHEYADTILEQFNEQVKRLWNLPLRIDENSGHNIDSIERALQKEIRDGGPLDFVIIDYLGLVETAGGNEKRYQALGEISRRLKALTEQYNLVTFILCQLGTKGLAQRPCRRPMLNDTYESGRIPQDCDAFYGIYWPGYYHSAEELKRAGYDPEVPLHWRVVEFLSLKGGGRMGGRGGKQPHTCLYFDAPHVRYRDLTSDDWAQMPTKRR